MSVSLSALCMQAYFFNYGNCLNFSYFAVQQKCLDREDKLSQFFKYRVFILGAFSQISVPDKVGDILRKNLNCALAISAKIHCSRDMLAALYRQF
ncbi:MAG: hypothetical protein ACFB16_16335 [Phormidesmis sp.]